MPKLSPAQIETVRTNPPVNFTVEEAAAYARISVRKLWDEFHSHTSGLRGARIGKRVIFPRTNVDRWLALLTTQSA